ncbi:MAG: divergent polysaccharide deacetylase family protein [Spirochaetota bacterium]|nr:divergent polysaccharide deacetylase family protein [Spirochaetota bacterium]
MKRKGTLKWAVGAMALSLTLLIVTIYSVTMRERHVTKSMLLKTNPPFKDDKDWIHAFMEKLGDFETLKPISSRHFKKNIFVIRNKNELSDYEKAFSRYLADKDIRYSLDHTSTENYHSLLIMFEREKDFMRIVEIKKRRGKFIRVKSKHKDNPSVISIVIDDAGKTRALEEEYLSFPYPLTFAVLPFEPYSRSFALKAHQQGKEVIIHAPMEGSDDEMVDGELKSTMSDKVMWSLIKDYRRVLPHAVGLSNHRGSLATSDPVLMRRFFKKLKSKPLFFLDSKTSPDSKALSTAKKMGIASVSRDIFLDHRDNLTYITSQMNKLIRLGRTKHGAVGIGHFDKANLYRVLRDMAPHFKRDNVHIVPLSRVVRGDKTYVSLRN